MWEKKAEQAWWHALVPSHPASGYQCQSPCPTQKNRKDKWWTGVEIGLHVRTLSSTTREKGRSWMWLMRCKRQWIFSQCDYTLGSAINLRQFWCLSILQTFYHNAMWGRGVWQGIENQISLGIVPPTAWECHAKQWTLDMTLKAINKHVMLWRQGKLSKPVWVWNWTGWHACWLLGSAATSKKMWGGNQVLE